MNHQAFQSYTPRALPLEYDSLENEVGCQPISGNGAHSLKPFIEFCAAEHDESSELFNQPLTVSYTEGPIAAMGDEPFRSNWAFWVATNGIRGGLSELVIPPADSDGQPSSLYPSTTPEDLSAAFGANGMLHLAIQKSDATIEIKYYTSQQGNASTVDFLGNSPLMVYTGLVMASAEEGAADMICLYLREEKPFALFARFAREAYAIEYTIHENLPRALAKLIEAQSDGFQLNVYARDDRGFDITLHSSDYAADLGEENATLTAEISEGLYVESAVLEELDEEFATLTASVASGNYFDPIVDSDTDEESATLSVSIAGGAYTTAK